ncbi:hypothetical protein O77CONTIG1_00001 [Leptolyngbya sp. O-77]|nr:hypothetical protein O77CONTIG1_00001 [Leptolyngbya sp. O-77]
MDHLPLQVGVIHHVKIHNADAANTRRRQIEQQRRTQPARADAEDAGRLQPFLPLYTDLRQDQVSRISFVVVFG